METIRVPRPAPEAFHKNRRVSDLLLSQVEHFRHVAQKQSLKIDPEVARDVQTEGGAARFIAAVTRSLRAGAAKAKGKVVAMESGRRPASEGARDTVASGTVRRIAAQAETSKGTPAGRASASKKTAAAAVSKSATGGKKAAKAKAKAKPKPRKRS
jgi:hypothetical protein